MPAKSQFFLLTPVTINRQNEQVAGIGTPDCTWRNIVSWVSSWVKVYPQNVVMMRKCHISDCQHSAIDPNNIAEHVSIIDRQWKAMGIKLYPFIARQKLISSLVTDVHKTDVLNKMLFMLVAQAHMKILAPDYLFNLLKRHINYLLRRQNCTFYNLSKRILTFLILYSKNIVVSNVFDNFQVLPLSLSLSLSFCLYNI